MGARGAIWPHLLFCLQDTPTHLLHQEKQRTRLQDKTPSTPGKATERRQQTKSSSLMESCGLVTRHNGPYVVNPIFNPTWTSWFEIFCAFLPV